MRITYDAQADAMYIRLNDTERGKLQTKEMGNGIFLDFSPNGNLVGIEVLDAAQYLGQDGKIQLELGPVRLDKEI